MNNEQISFNFNWLVLLLTCCFILCSGLMATEMYQLSASTTATLISSKSTSERRNSFENEKQTERWQVLINSSPDCIFTYMA